jgi:hypothetical protein
MTDSSAQTLANIQRLLDAQIVTPDGALKAAYALGKLDGQIEMAAVGEQTLENLRIAVKVAA